FQRFDGVVAREFELPRSALRFEGEGGRRDGYADRESLHAHVDRLRGERGAVEIHQELPRALPGDGDRLAFEVRPRPGDWSSAARASAPSRAPLAAGAARTAGASGAAEAALTAGAP